MHKVYLIIISLLVSFYSCGQISNCQDDLTPFLQLHYLCDPCFSAYEHFGTKGYVQIDNNIIFKDGYIISNIVSHSTMSNGWYNYINNQTFHKVVYESNYKTTKFCNKQNWGSHLKGGEPSLDWNHQPQKIKRDTLIYNLDFDGEEFELICDSILYYKTDKFARIYTITNDSISIKSSIDMDPWDITIYLIDGLPSKIINYRGEQTNYKYSKFDKMGNWIQRERIDEHGNVISIYNRDLKYFN